MAANTNHTACTEANQADGESEGAAVLRAGLTWGRHVDGPPVNIGDSTYHQFTEIVPGTSGKLDDVTLRIGLDVAHHGWLDDTTDRTTKYYHPGGVFADVVVTSVIKNGVETITGVQSYVPTEIQLHVGDSFLVKTPITTAAGVAPSTLDPVHDSNLGTTSHSYGCGNDGNDLASMVGHPTFGKGGDDDDAKPAEDLGCPNRAPEAVDFDWQRSGGCHDSGAPGPISTSDTVTPEGAFASEDSSPGSAGSGEGSTSGGSTSGGSTNGGDDDTKGDETADLKEEAPTTDEKGDMPNPDGGPGSPNSTPNPEGGDDGGENGHHGPTVNLGTSVGHMSTQLAAAGNNQDGSGVGYHGPHDPGEEMPNPEDAGGGSPTSNVAHGATSFWDQAAAATQGITTQGATSGQHLATSAMSDQASQGQLVSAATTATAAQDATSHDVSAAPADASAHTAVSHDLAPTDAALHGELGTATFHDATSLSSAAFATQMHV